MSDSYPHTNQLVNEASLYLKQHAHNPVNWLPWSTEAFEKAEKENKLVLISIGYSSCHWCHVMEKESFENEAVAAIMNKNFVCIKVDREEHPDVDDVYMLAVQLMTKQGGWPLNCFTLPNGKPIYGGTYFPKNKWVEVLNLLHESYSTKPDKVISYAENLTNAIEQNNALIALPKDSAEIQTIDFSDINNGLERSFDLSYGGHKREPKFPMPVEWQYYLTSTYYQPNTDLSEHITRTLNHMVSGAMYDQIGGGFSRYSVDQEWKIPHFEKMLYDNAQLISLYSNAYRSSGSKEFLRVAEESAEFLLRDMYNAKSGGFYSALDADSEGEEGKFYVFTQKELLKLIPKDLFDLARAWFGLDKYALWEHDNYILGNRMSDTELKEKFGWDSATLSANKDVIKKNLLQYREQRTWPGLDDKEIASWNALTAIGFCDLYKASGKEKYKKQVTKSLNFFEEYLHHDNGIWRYYKSDSKKIEGTLEDYANYALAYLRAAEIEDAPNRILKAKKIVEKIDATFLQSNALFYNSSSVNSNLISNPIELSDNVIPSVNATMAEVLFLMSKSEYAPKQEKRLLQMMQHMQSSIQDYSSGYFKWMELYQRMQHSYNELVVVNATSVNHSKLLQTFAPDILILPLTKDTEVPSIFNGKYQRNQELYYLCTNKVCQKPTNNLEALQQILK
jgi:uncharacterized protein YyaL (SSP411 family)